MRLAAGAFLSAGLVFGGARAYGWARATPFFALEHVSFSGLSMADEAELLRVSGLSAGQNLWTLDLEAAKGALGGHPWVKGVELSLRLPRTVAVRVTEQRAAAMAPLGDLYLVDEGGRPFKRLSSDDSVDVPLITGVSREEYVARPGDAIERLALGAFAARAYAASAGAGACPLSEVRLSGRELTLVMQDGQEVSIGAPGRVAPALERLAKVRDELSRRSLVASVIHLENRARPDWVAVQLFAPADMTRARQK